MDSSEERELGLLSAILLNDKSRRKQAKKHPFGFGRYFDVVRASYLLKLS